MGFYLDVPEPKADFLVDNHQGVRLSDRPDVLADIPKDRMLICVVDNFTFEAAGIAFDDQELRRFSDHDGRPREWLTIPRDEAVKICSPVLVPYIQGEKNWRA